MRSALRIAEKVYKGTINAAVIIGGAFVLFLIVGLAISPK